MGNLIRQSRWFVTVFFAVCAVVVSEESNAQQFTDVTSSAGVNYTQWHVGPFDPDRLHMTGGAAARDYDGDGSVDLFVTRLGETDILYRNLGNGTFQDVSVAAGFTQSLRSNGATWGDIDNDGDADLYVTTIVESTKRNYLYINDGNGRFTEEAVTRGVDTTTSATLNGFGSTFGDYDRDGYLDLLTVEWTLSFDASHTRLFRNLGASNPGTFENVTLSAGVNVNEDIPGAITYGFSPTFADMDRDGHVDIVVAGDFGSSQLLWNNGDGTFSNGTVPAAVGTDENGMGSAIGDYDGDGDLDWFVSSIYDTTNDCSNAPCNWGNSGNRLFQNNGDRTFTDVTDQTGVREGGWGWGATFVDYDNDGDLDLAQTNGIDFLRATIDASFVNDPTRFWENDNGVFTDVATTAGIVDSDSGKGLLKLDYDNDGNEDLFIVNNASEPILYRNEIGSESNNTNSWLRIKTIGTISNADGIGAQITILADETAPDESIYHEVTAGSNFLGQNDIDAHFGLGDLVGTIDRITIEWPVSGVTQILEDVDPNLLLTITEPSGLNGDFNGDGLVDGADFTVWRDHLGMADEVELNDNGDGANGVDAADLELWRNNFGANAREGLANDASTVPEPTQFHVLGFLLALLIRSSLNPRFRFRRSVS